VSARPIRPARPLAALVAGALALACGPYVNLGEQLDVTVSLADGETWIAGNADGTDVRVLVLAESKDGVPAGFSLASIQFPVTAGLTASELQGEWVAGAGTAATFRVRSVYTLPDESDRSPFSRVGAHRDAVDVTSQVTIERTGDALVLAGDPSLAGHYLRLRRAVAALGTTTPHDAACAFQLMNVATQAFYVRVLGFGGALMLQYKDPASYLGTIGGSGQVRLEGSLNTKTTFTFVGLVELSGTHLEGVQTTTADTSGDGEMGGVLTWTIVPVGASGEELPALVAHVDFGGGGDPADAVQITRGNASGGHYAVTLDGGGAARISPVTAPSPSVTECLTLP
jgi:hypothetical protein